MTQKGTEKEVKDYVKERYRSAIQLLRNIDQRKNTILRTCESIIRLQRDFLEKGVDAIKPMMIKDIAEEIGVHPSTQYRTNMSTLRRASSNCASSSPKVRAGLKGRTHR
jgi:RNA polymerase sigma-54 factor